MIEMKIDILSDAIINSANAICFTSNGIVKANNELVMGAGIAKQFKEKWPGLPMFFGAMVKLHGNHVHYFEQQISYTKDLFIVSFPTKNDWKHDSNIGLIKQSANELLELSDRLNITKAIYLPRPGCLNGKLDWEKVKPAIKDILDDRFIITCL